VQTWLKFLSPGLRLDRVSSVFGARTARPEMRGARRARVRMANCIFDQRGSVSVEICVVGDSLRYGERGR
jgi:hypothetical protein